MKSLVRKYLGGLYEYSAHIYFKILGHIAPKRLAAHKYKSLTGRAINWNAPRDYNEKINWLKFYSDTSMWPLFADKYRVREYINSKGLGETLNDLYGVWDNADKVDFDSLPNQFVLKSNNGCATVLIVKNKESLDVTQTRTLLKKWLKLKYGYETAEPHYLKIKPLIIAERYLEDMSSGCSSLIDYKVVCSYGKILYILVCYDRVIGEEPQKQVYSEDWVLVHDALRKSHKHPHAFERTENIDKILEYSKLLSKDHPNMRVDWYIVDNQIFFGEITMTPAGGYASAYTTSFLNKIGDMIDLSGANK